MVARTSDGGSFFLPFPPPFFFGLGSYYDVLILVLLLAVMAWLCITLLVVSYIILAVVERFV